MPDSRRSVLALHAYRSDVWKAQYAGLCRYCLPRKWLVEDIFLGVSPDFDVVRRRLETGDVVGILTSLPVPLPVEVVSGLPVVCFDCPQEAVPAGCPQIRHDAAYTARLAARELASLSVRHFAFVHSPSGSYWSVQRGAAFEQEIRSRGGALESSFPQFGVFYRRRLLPALMKWIRALPRPCGLFAANDEIARLVLSACGRLSLRVPDEIAVVGVDNDSRHCLSTPALSTILPDWNAGAFLAAKTLDRLVQGLAFPVEAMAFKPLGLVRRQSTGSGLAMRLNPRVQEAVDLIRAEACSGLRAERVIGEMHASRRYAEQIFRKVTGMSILEAIRTVRFENAQVLLEGTDKSVADIAILSGYQSIPTFCREFKDLTGLSPLGWRRKCANG